MLVLAIDTSSELSSFALVRDGVILTEHAVRAPSKHAETLLPSLERALLLAGVELSSVELFAVGVGPGSFTGLRIGLATVKGFGLAMGTPVVRVSSLRAIAAALEPTREPVAVAIDAHKDEVYAALYIDGDLKLGPIHAQPERAAERLREAAGSSELVLVGDGASRYGERLTTGLGAHRRASRLFDAPRAAVLAGVAERVMSTEGPTDLAALAPDYVRDSDAKLPASPVAR